MWKMESREVLGVQTPEKIMFKKFEKTIPWPQFLGLVPSSSFWPQDFKTLQIAKDWGWNLDNEQDWVPKNGGLLT
jgi:hypothetical protein